MTLAEIRSYLPQFISRRYSDAMWIYWANAVLEIMQRDANISELLDEYYLFLSDGRNEYQIPTRIRRIESIYNTSALGHAIRNKAGAVGFQNRPNGVISMDSIPSVGPVEYDFALDLKMSSTMMRFEKPVLPALYVAGDLTGFAYKTNNDYTGRCMKWSEDDTYFYIETSRPINSNATMVAGSVVQFTDTYVVGDYILAFADPAIGDIPLAQDQLDCLIAGLRWKAETHQEDVDAHDMRWESIFRTQLREIRNRASRNMQQSRGSSPFNMGIHV